jgi:hypothetical protein
MKPRFLIAWDSASRRYPFRVVTRAGECCGYFRSITDAVRYCVARP